MVSADISISACDFHNAKVNTCHVSTDPRGRSLAQRNVWFTPPHKQLKGESSKRGSHKHICCMVNQHAGRSCCVFRFACGLRSAGTQWGIWTMNFLTQRLAWGSYWFIVSSTAHKTSFCYLLPVAKSMWTLVNSTHVWLLKIILQIEKQAIQSKLT